MKNNKTKLSVEVAIAAYNAEKNIKRLVESILSQQTKNFILKKVIVNSDVSSDQTVKIVNEIKSKYIQLRDTRTRRGFAGTFIDLLTSSKADILVILNDDIIIKDKLFLEKTLTPFITDDKLGLVCCNAQAIRSNNFVSEAVRSGYLAYKRISEETRGGNNVYTIEGKALSLSRALIETITFPQDYTKMANVDKFVYFSCLKNHLKYKYVKEAVMYFRCPQTIKDFVRWQTRNLKSNKYIEKEVWGKLAQKEFVLSSWKFRYYKFLELLKNPAGSVLILFLGFYCSYYAKLERHRFNTLWETVRTTKDLQNGN